MAQISKERLEEFKQILKEDCGIEFTSDQEAFESANGLVNFFSVLVRIDREEQMRKEKLKEHPKGYAMPGGGRSCRLCGFHLMDSEEMWYDKWGMKCLCCQEALNKRIVPGYVFNDIDNKDHANDSTLSWKLDVPISTIRRLARQGKLKARTIPGRSTLVFLRKENPDIVAIIEEEKALVRQKKAAKTKASTP